MAAPCDICGEEVRPGHAMACRSNLRRRLKQVQVKAARSQLQRGPIKDQSGVSESDRWLAEHGGGTYGARVLGRNLDERKTRPVNAIYRERVIAQGECLGCGAGLSLMTNPRGGGSYYACERAGHSCYYIGTDKRSGYSYELIVVSAED